MCLSWKHKSCCCSAVSSVFAFTYRHFSWRYMTLVNLDTNVCFQAQFHHLAVLTHPGGVIAAAVVCVCVCVRQWVEAPQTINSRKAMEGIRCRQSRLLLRRENATGHFLHLWLTWVCLCARRVVFISPSLTRVHNRRRRWTWWGEMICTGALKGHMMSTREEKPKLNLQSKCSSASSWGGCWAVDQILQCSWNSLL